MFYENVSKLKSDPLGALRTTGQAMQDNNARLSQLAVLVYGVNNVNQQLAESTGLSVMPVVTSAASSLLMLGAFFSNPSVQNCMTVGLSTCAQVIPDSVKNAVFPKSETAQATQEDPAELSSAKSHSM